MIQHDFQHEKDGHEGDRGILKTYAQNIGSYAAVYLHR